MSKLFYKRTYPYKNYLGEEESNRDLTTITAPISNKNEDNRLSDLLSKLVTSVLISKNENPSNEQEMDSESRPEVREEIDSESREELSFETKKKQQPYFIFDENVQEEYKPKLTKMISSLQFQGILPRSREGVIKPVPKYTIGSAHNNKKGVIIQIPGHINDSASNGCDNLADFSDNPKAVAVFESCISPEKPYFIPPAT